MVNHGKYVINEYIEAENQSLSCGPSSMCHSIERKSSHKPSPQKKKNISLDATVGSYVYDVTLSGYLEQNMNLSSLLQKPVFGYSFTFCSIQTSEH